MRLGLVSAFYPRLVGGAETALETMVLALLRLGADIRVFTLEPAKRADYEVPIPNAHLIPRKLRLLGGQLFDRFLARNLAPLLRENHIDVLNAWDTYVLPGSVGATRRHSMPVVASVHNNIGVPYTWFGVPKVIGRLFEKREKALIEAACASRWVLGNSRFTATALVGQGVPRDRVRALYFAGGVLEWPVASKLAGAGEFRVLAVGRLHEHKGFQVLISAVSQLVRRGVSPRLVIVGTGPHAAKLRAQAVAHGVRANVRFVGARSAAGVKALMDASTVVVVPTLTPEPFGRVAVEAMSRARPVVASRTGGLQEIVDDGTTGFLVEPGNAEDLATALLALARDSDLAYSIGQQALADCRSRFDALRIANELVVMCTSALSDGDAKAHE